MKERFQRKIGFREVLFSRATLVILIIISVLLLFSLLNIVKKNKETVKNKELALTEIEELKQKEIDLQSAIGDLKTERGLEENIREKFRVVKEGEELIIIVDDENTNQSLEQTEDGSRFVRFLKKLF